MTKEGENDPRELRMVLLKVAWLSVGLGLTAELFIALAQLGFGIDLGGGRVAADTLKAVSWSTFVCVGVAAGRVASNGRPLGTGLAGLIAAPAAFAVAKAVHSGVSAATGAPASNAVALVTVGTIAAIKAVEYGSLGAIIAWVGRQHWSGLLSHILIGLGLGVVFGGAILAVQGIPLRPLSADLLSWAINEVLFPAGCAAVLFVTNIVGQRVRS